MSGYFMAVKTAISKAIDTLKASFAASNGAGLVGFIQSGTGAVATNVQEVLRRYVSVKDCGAVGDGVTDDTAAIQAAFTAAGASNAVFFPKGTYLTSSTITATCSFYGTGSGTVIKPSGNYEVFVVSVGRANKINAEFVKQFVIDCRSVPSRTSACKGMWLSKGGTSAATSGNNNVEFSNISIYGAHHGIYQSAADLGNLWNCAFNNIFIFDSLDRGIALDLSGSNGSLNVFFENVVLDHGTSATARGAFINSVSNLKFYGVSTSAIGTNGAAFYCLNSTNVDVRLQIEGCVASAANSGLVMFQNCPNVELSLVAQTCTFNPGVGNAASYVYVDSNVRTLVIRAFRSLGEVVSSGTIYIVNCFDGSASNTKLCVLDQNITSSLVLASSQIKNDTRWPDTNYALEKTSTTRRVHALDVLVASATATNLVSVADYSGRVHQVGGLYLVQGTWSFDNTVGFTDLVLVTGVGQTTTQTVVVVSSNSINGGQARTYSISGGFLRVALTFASGSYRVSVTGIDQAGALS